MTHEEKEFEKWLTIFEDTENKENIYITVKVMATMYFRYPLFEDYEIQRVNREMKSGAIPNKTLPLLSKVGKDGLAQYKVSSVPFNIDKSLPSRSLLYQILAIVSNDESGCTYLNLSPTICLHRRDSWFVESSSLCAKYMPVDVKMGSLLYKTTRGTWDPTSISNANYDFEDTTRKENGIWSYCKSVMSDGVYWFKVVVPV